MSHPTSLTDGYPGAVHPASQEPMLLSPDRAFVVHFYGAASGAVIEAGRAEHVRSGRTTHFESWDQLAAFVSDVVGVPPAGPGGPR